MGLPSSASGSSVMERNSMKRRMTHSSLMTNATTNCPCAFCTLRTGAPQLHRGKAQVLTASVASQFWSWQYGSGCTEIDIWEANANAPVARRPDRFKGLDDKDGQCCTSLQTILLDNSVGHAITHCALGLPRCDKGNLVVWLELRALPGTGDPCRHLLWSRRLRCWPCSLL